jgi:tetratricopeptide (TPR) repeat protein
MVDAHGGTAVHTGKQAIPEACHHEGSGFTVQANLMMKNTVCDAMVRAYTQTDSDLAGRMMAALEAAQAEGGDIRGKQSAALLVVRGETSGKPWADRLFELRIEDHAEPIQELRRLLKVARAYQHMQAGDDFLTEGDIDRALEEYSRAEEILPDRSEPIFWHAVTLASIGRVDESIPLFAKAFEMFPDWRILVPRLPAAGLLPDDDGLIRRIETAGR